MAMSIVINTLRNEENPLEGYGRSDGRRTPASFLRGG